MNICLPDKLPSLYTHSSTPALPQYERNSCPSNEPNLISCLSGKWSQSQIPFLRPDETSCLVILSTFDIEIILRISKAYYLCRTSYSAMLILDRFFRRPSSSSVICPKLIQTQRCLRIERRSGQFPQKELPESFLRSRVGDPPPSYSNQSFRSSLGGFTT
ncbi:hypothetical protein FE257_005813 [Aspergillus nanangensis]|uniref:Uncharacterized protein n=1 Tax=Aspergillus nanangensis TaxID=2582783 RepID=A0AAD4GMS1_ASPNN|nr:hypothetical protein FE257_005813 [Aspergillus nanangensis]